MFGLLALISYVGDIFIVTLYCSKRTAFGDNEDSTVWKLLNPLDSALLLVVLAALRVFVFIPYVWRYLKEDLLVLSQRPYIWHIVNVTFVLFKAIAEVANEGPSQNSSIWIAIGCSLMSVYCQSAALKRLVSTALPERHVVLGLSLPHGNSSVMKAGVDRKESMEKRSSTSQRKSSDRLLAHRVASYYTDTTCSPPDPEAGSEFLLGFREQLDKAHTEWNEKIAKLKESIANFGSENESFSRPDAIVFDELLLLFATNNNNPKNNLGYKVTCNEKLIDQSDLETALIVDQQGVTSINTKETFLSLFSRHPKTLEFYIPQLVVYLLYGYAPTSAELREALLLICARSAHFAHRIYYFIEAYCISGAGINSDGVVMLRQLLKSIENVALPSAEMISSGNCNNCYMDHLSMGRSSTGQDSPRQYISIDNDLESSPAEITETVGEYPLVLIRPFVADSNAFTSTLLFWEHLATLSRDLVPFCKEDRKKELQQRIPEVKKRFLPSSCIYAPVGNQYHRVWSIVDDECFAFSTKSRAPMFVCLEVVDYLFRRGARKPRVSPNVESAGISWVHGIKRVMSEVGESLNISQPSRSAATKKISEEVDSDNEEQEKHFDKSHNTTASNFKTNHTNRRHTVGNIEDIAGQWGISSKWNKNLEDDEKKESKADWFNTLDTEYRQRATMSNDSNDPVNCFSQPADQPVVVFKERWRDKEKRLRSKSGVGNLRGYRLLPVIVKTNDDLRQEEIAAQLLFLMNQILLDGEVRCWLRPYGIVAMSEDSGLIEAIPDTVSMDALRRSVPNYTTLTAFYENFFGPKESAAFVRGRENFVMSLAPYCIVCYILNLKDRHNGNILLDRKGHVMHIDFGFIFGISPGGNIGFESAPFKLTSEFVELMDGPHSETFQHFRDCCVQTFMELRKHHYRIALLLEMISVGNEHLPCFAGDPGRIIDEMRKRFVPHMHDQAAATFVHTLINRSIDNWTTSCYDKYQKCCVGVF